MTVVASALNRTSASNPSPQDSGNREEWAVARECKSQKKWSNAVKCYLLDMILSLHFGTHCTGLSQQDQPAFWQAVLTEHCGFKRKREERKRAHHRRMGGMHVGGVWEGVIEGGYDQGTLCICMKLLKNKRKLF